MADMEEYARCLDVIGRTNHIIALDEVSDTQSEIPKAITNSEPKNSDNAPKQILVDETSPSENVTQTVSVTNFLNNNSGPLISENNIDAQHLAASLRENGQLNSSLNGFSGDTND